MNKLIDWLISIFKDINKQNNLYLISFYNKIRLLINKNFAIGKIYRPIIEQKTIINKNLMQTLKSIDTKNKEAENHILKLQKENALIESKISIIQDLITKRHD
jgi:hypothetical protein